MRLSAKAREALDKVIAQFKSGDLSPVVRIARLQRREGDKPSPSSRWSMSNQIMAFIQTGELDCRGYRQWQSVGRQVQKGSKAAYILGPILVKVENEETGETAQALKGFKSIAVFPLGATKGDPLPEFDYTPRELPPLLDVAKRLGTNVTWVPTLVNLGSSKTDGSEIKLGSHSPAVFFHELAHAAHAKLDGKLKGGQDSHQEAVAEFTATVLMQLYGFGDHTGNCWKYVQHLSADPLVAILKALSAVEKVLNLLLNTTGD